MTFKLICQHPDCTKPLLRENTSGMCRVHLHTKGLCTCRQCAGVKRMTPEQIKEHLAIEALLAKCGDDPTMILPSGKSSGLGYGRFR